MGLSLNCLKSDCLSFVLAFKLIVPKWVPGFNPDCLPKYLAPLAWSIFCWLPELGPVLGFRSKVHSGLLSAKPSTKANIQADNGTRGATLKSTRERQN